VNFGIPYMGSKQDIIASLALNFPKAENFYDLFGGGFSVTHYMMLMKSKRHQNFHFNELIPSTVELIKKAISGDFSYDKFKPEWVSREDFLKNKDTCAYTRLLWSFGNCQRTYMFGKDIEAYKKSLHMAVVFDQFDNTARSILQITAWPNDVKTILQKRFYAGQKVAHSNKGMSAGELKQLQVLQQLQRVERLQVLEQLQRVERLQQLERLERLQKLEQLTQLTMTSLDYSQVTIKPNSLVYCDIPYRNTGKYTVEFDYQRFFDWAASAEFPVFISEYQIDDSRFKLVYTVDKKTKLSPKGMTKAEPEKLYWNGKG